MWKQSVGSNMAISFLTDSFNDDVSWNFFRFLTEEEGTVIHEHLGKEQSRLALYVVNQLNLVPEHVETRSLYSKTQQPNMEQVSL